jgi:hypothetical protein
VFWTDRLSAHTGLPASQTIYSFHPITFLATLARSSQGCPALAGRAPPGHRRRRPAHPSVDDWNTPARWPRRAAHLRPVIGAETKIRKKAEIPLIVLPD